MTDYKYTAWHDVPKTKENLYGVLFGYLYVEHNGNLYEAIRTDTDYQTEKLHIILSDINNGDPLFTSWFEILHSPAFSIKRKEG